MIFSQIFHASKEKMMSGFFNLECLSDEDLQQTVSLTLDELKIVAHRFSTSLSEARNIGIELSGLESHTRKAKLIDWLNRRPIIEIDDKAYSDKFSKIIAPSPWKLFTACGRFLMYEFFDFLMKNCPESGAYILRGKAFENYLNKVLTPTQVARITKPKHYKGKYPDFEWHGEKFRILIEAKFRITPNSDYEISCGSSLIETWRRADECLDQADEYIRFTHGVNTKKTVLLIVTNESLTEELVSFMRIAKRYGFLDHLAIDAIYFISPSELEHFASNWSADKLGPYIEKIWTAIEPHQLSMKLRLFR